MQSPRSETCYQVFLLESDYLRLDMMLLAGGASHTVPGICQLLPLLSLPLNFPQVGRLFHKWAACGDQLAQSFLKVVFRVGQTCAEDVH